MPPVLPVQLSAARTVVVLRLAYRRSDLFHLYGLLKKRASRPRSEAQRRAIHESFLFDAGQNVYSGPRASTHQLR